MKQIKIFCTLLLIVLACSFYKADAQFVPFQSAQYKHLAADTLYDYTGCGRPTSQPLSYKRVVRYYDSCNHKEYDWQPEYVKWIQLDSLISSTGGGSFDTTANNIHSTGWNDLRYELLANKATDFITLNNTKYPTTNAVRNYILSFGYEVTANKVTTLDSSNTHYPSTGAVKSALNDSAASIRADFPSPTMQNTFDNSVTAGELLPMINTGTNRFYVSGQDANHIIKSASSTTGHNYYLTVDGGAEDVGLVAGANQWLLMSDHYHSGLPSGLGYVLTDTSGNGDYVPRAPTGTGSNDPDSLGGLAAADYEIIANKQTTLDNSTTHYPSTSAVTMALALKLNISDTASMLSKYLRANDTTNKWVQQVAPNITNDSLIVTKNGVRSAYKYPTGGGGGGIDTITKSNDTIYQRKNSVTAKAYFQPKVYYAKDSGVVADGTYAIGVNMTNGSATLTCSSCSFSSADAGKVIAVNNAAGSSNTLKTTISSVTNSTTIVLASTASATITSDTAVYGTDNTTNLQKCFTAVATTGGTLKMPAGIILLNTVNGTTNSNLYIPQPVDTLHKTFTRISGESVSALGGSGYLISFPSQNQLTGTILYSLSSGSGTFPSVIASYNATNKNDVLFDNFSIMVYTNHGHSAISMTGIKGHDFQHLDATNLLIYPDIILTRTSTPASSEVAGITVGHNLDNGSNFIKGCMILGFKYGVVADEHTILDGNSIYGCIYGLTIPYTTHGVQGNSQIFACFAEIYSPTVSIFGENAGEGHLMDFIVESEYDSISTGLSAIPVGAFYKSRWHVLDSNANLQGNVVFNNVANSTISNTYASIATYGTDAKKFWYRTTANPPAVTNVDNVFSNQTIKNQLTLKNNNGYVGYLSKANGSTGLYAANDLLLENGVKGDMVFANDSAASIFKWGLSSNSAPYMILDNSSNLSLTGSNPVTKLDVYGTNASNSIGRIGHYELSTLGSSNSFIGDNVYYDGANFKYRSTGTGNVIYTLNGTYSFRTVGNGSSGTTATPVQRFYMDTLGAFGIGGSQTNGTTTGATFAMTSAGLARIGTTTNSTYGLDLQTGDLRVMGSANTVHTIWVQSYDNSTPVVAFRMASGGLLEFGDVGNAGMTATTFWYGGNEKMRLTSNGLSIGSTTSATAKLLLAAGTASANTAPLKFTSGTNLTTPEAGTVEYDGTNFYHTTAGGRGTVPLSMAQNDLTAQTTAGNITTLTSAAANSTYNVGGYINVTAVSTDVIQIQVTYTDENNTSQTVSFTTLNTVTNSTYNPVTIRVKGGTTITLKTNLTVGAGSITFDAGGYIQKAY